LTGNNAPPILPPSESITINNQSIVSIKSRDNIDIKYCKIILCFAMSTLILNYTSVVGVMANPPEPSLSAIVFFGIPSVKEVKQNINLKTTNECIKKYLQAIPQKSYLWSADVPSGPESAVNYKRHNLEEQIVIAMGEKTRDEAKLFSMAVPLQSEWEGMSEGPLEEANFVDNWLNKRPHTSIAPFLHLFKAHRIRAGYECARAGREKGLWPILAKRYRESLERSISSANPLISCIAKDLEEQAHVYLEGYGRP
jgi:hypothetical protein